MVNEPEKIWIEQDDCPYFYFESELSEVCSPVMEYTRSDLVAELEAENERLKHALEAANKRADEAEARRKCYECGSEMTACARCNPELTTAERDTLRARVAELEAALTYALNEYDLMTWGEDYEYRNAGERVQEIIEAALKGAPHAE